MMTKLKYFVKLPGGIRYILSLILLPNALLIVFLDLEELGRILTGLVFCALGVIELVNGGIAYFVAYREMLGLFKAAAAFALGYIFYQWLIPELITNFQGLYFVIFLPLYP